MVAFRLFFPLRKEGFQSRQRFRVLVENPRHFDLEIEPVLLSFLGGENAFLVGLEGAFRHGFEAANNIICSCLQLVRGERPVDKTQAGGLRTVEDLSPKYHAASQGGTEEFSQGLRSAGSRQ